MVKFIPTSNCLSRNTKRIYKMYPQIREGNSNRFPFFLYYCLAIYVTKAFEFLGSAYSVSIIELRKRPVLRQLCFDIIRTYSLRFMIFNSYFSRFLIRFTNYDTNISNHWTRRTLCKKVIEGKLTIYFFKLSAVFLNFL